MSIDFVEAILQFHFYSCSHTSRLPKSVHLNANQNTEYTYPFICTFGFFSYRFFPWRIQVFGLQNKLQQEVDLHYALENAFRQEAGALSTFPNLPDHVCALANFDCQMLLCRVFHYNKLQNKRLILSQAQRLVTDVAMLELAILNLEEQIASLNLQLGYEQRERHLAEGTLLKLPLQNRKGQVREPGCNLLSPIETGHKPLPCCVSPNALPNTSSPRLCNITSPSKNRLVHHPAETLTSPTKQGTLHLFYSSDDIGSRSDCLVQNAKLGCKHFWQQSGFFSPDKVY